MLFRGRLYYALQNENFLLNDTWQYRRHQKKNVTFNDKFDIIVK